MDSVRNEERAEIERQLESRADQRILRFFGHVKKMDECRMARRVLMAEVSGGRVPGRPSLGWMNGVKVALGKRDEKYIYLSSNEVHLVLLCVHTYS